MPKGKISYIQNDEPEFIKRFKQKVGYKEGPTVDTKREIPSFDEDGEDARPDNDDEKPVVVQLREGDLTAEEVEQMEKEELVTDGKIKFKKPVKRSGEETELTPSTKKKKEGSGEKRKEEKKDKKKSSKGVKNATLLSFNEDEEDGT
uniref:Uncharacterized protein KIAA1143 homolog n=1 Tax=Crassostrea virginica TaxID=6565 RepID=A0A8B8C8V1_CRAVI|nr:uncharacterized protein KIAA1143 homolog [Crassostrea virginica]XP_022312173.1 uncharacterized protein KIAA1143 homolog [Crassostrea virginica]